MKTQELKKSVKKSRGNFANKDILLIQMKI